MKQRNVKKLVSLIANYVKHLNEEYATATDAYYTSWVFLNQVESYFDLTLTPADEVRMIKDTIAALNAGNEEADRDAFEIRLKALCSGDDELIEKIEYLHDVI